MALDGGGWRQQMRRWRISGLIEFPLGIQRTADGMNFLCRIPTGNAMIAGVAFSIRASPEPPAFASPKIHADHPDTWASVACELEAARTSPGDAVAMIGDSLDLLVDLLSFQMQVRLRISALDAIDVTPPVNVGDLRDCEVWPYPDGYMPPKELAARGPNAQVRAVPLLPRDPPVLEQAHAIALQWYLKALTEPGAANRYISLWVALEALIAANGAETGKDRGMGARARAYLRACGVSPEVAADLWRARNIVHGAHAFDTEVMQSLPMLASHLMAVVATRLKIAVGIPADEPPIVAPSQFLIAGLALGGGQREIEPDDLGSMQDP